MIRATLALTRETASLALELALILTEAACEVFLDARRGDRSRTVLDWAEYA